MKKLTALFLLTSCITTTEVSESYEGRWHSDRLPFGDLASEAVIELADGETRVEVDGEYKGGGHYTIVEDVAVFGWNIDLYGENILFLDAMLTDEVLFVHGNKIGKYYKDHETEHYLNKISIGPCSNTFVSNLPHNVVVLENVYNKVIEMPGQNVIVGVDNLGKVVKINPMDAYLDLKTRVSNLESK